MDFAGLRSKSLKSLDYGNGLRLPTDLICEIISHCDAKTAECMRILCPGSYIVGSGCRTYGVYNLNDDLYINRAVKKRVEEKTQGDIKDPECRGCLIDLIPGKVNYTCYNNIWRCEMCLIRSKRTSCSVRDNLTHKYGKMAPSFPLI